MQNKFIQVKKKDGTFHSYSLNDIEGYYTDGETVILEFKDKKKELFIDSSCLVLEAIEFNKIMRNIEEQELLHMESALLIQEQKG